MGTAIEVASLHKFYGPVRAVDGISFTVEEGEIFGMVGPNGAGKTTTIECVEGLRRPDRGTVRVLGLDPQRDGYELRRRIGVQLQEASLPPRLTVWEALDLFGSFYSRRVDGKALLEQLGLADKRNAAFEKLSGGQKQRLFIALALINDPELVFLDELTTGLDPQARRAMWDLVRGIRERGKTIFLTTHFMEEAERLCDRVAIIDRGKIVALDTPARLKMIHGDRYMRVMLASGENLTLSLDDPADGHRLGELVAAGQVLTLHSAEATLEEVFIRVTGRRLVE